MAAPLTWFDRLCDRINPPMPDAMQARMLREVWNYWVLRRYSVANKIGIPAGFTRVYLSNDYFEEAP